MGLRPQQCRKFETYSDLQKGSIFRQGSKMADGAFQRTEHENITIDLTRFSEESLYQCEECKTQFSREGSFNRHVRNKSCKGHFQCTACDQNCRIKKHLQVSAQIRSEETPWQCKECMRCFGSKRSLKMHQKTHSKDRQHQFTKCGKRYTRMEYVTSHLRMHTKRSDVGDVPRDHKCKYKKPFSNISEERVNQCAECEQNVRQIDNHVKRHRRSKRVKSYQCTECEAIFEQNTYHIMKERKHLGERNGKMHMIIARLLEVSVPNEYFLSQQAENEDFQIIADAIREKLNLD